MGYHNVYLFHFALKLDGIGTALVASGLVLLFFECDLCSVPFRVVLKHFPIVRRLPGAMHQECLFCTGRIIARIS